VTLLELMSFQGAVHSLLFSWAVLVAGWRVAGNDELSGSCAFASG